MGKKAAFLLGAGVGYVLGARAGRARYDQIKGAGVKVWESSPVQHGVHTVEHKVTDLAREHGGAVTDKVADAVKAKLGSSSSPAEPPTAPNA